MTELASNTGRMLSIADAISATCGGVEPEDDRIDEAEEKRGGIFPEA